MQYRRARNRLPDLDQITTATVCVATHPVLPQMCDFMISCPYILDLDSINKNLDFHMII